MVKHSGRVFGTGCRKRGRWTPAKETVARTMREAGATYERIAEVVGMTHQTVGIKLSGKRYNKPETTGRLHFQHVSLVRPSERALEDREQRAVAEAQWHEQMVRRGDLSFMIGDMPPPGRSALDRKRAGV